MKTKRSSILLAIVFAVGAVLAQDVTLIVNGEEMTRTIPVKHSETVELIQNMAKMFNTLSVNHSQLELKYKEEVSKNQLFLERAKKQIDSIDLLIKNYDSLLYTAVQLEKRSQSLQDSLSQALTRVVNGSHLRVWNCGIGVAYIREQDKKDAFTITPWVSYKKIAIGPIVGTEYGVYIGYSMW